MLLSLVNFLFLTAFLPVCRGITDDQVAKLALERLELIEVDYILSNNRILNSYIKCMNRTGVCSPEARDFRKLTPFALRTSCAKCTDKQKSNLRKIFQYVRTERPDDWNMLSKIYDPDGSLKKRVEEFLRGDSS